MCKDVARAVHVVDVRQMWGGAVCKDVGQCMCMHVYTDINHIN